MANGIPINGEPEGNVFGIVGEVALSDLGNAYVKKSNDTLNIGWDKFLEPNIFEFEEISLTSVTQFGPSSITGSTNAPSLYFDLPSGTANIAVEVFINTPGYSFTEVAPLWVQVNDAAPKISTSGTYYYFEQNNLIARENHHVRASCKIDRRISITIKVTKIGGYGSMFKNAKAWGRMGQGAEMVLQVYNTNQFSRGKIQFADALENVIPVSSSATYSFDLYNNQNNFSSFYGGGQINAKATILTGETSIGYIEIKDFYDQFSSQIDITNFSSYYGDSPIPIKLFAAPPLIWIESGITEIVKNYEVITS